MAQQVVYTGKFPGDGTGDPGKTAFDKLNANDAELYAEVAALGGGAVAPTSLLAHQTVTMPGTSVGPGTVGENIIGVNSTLTGSVNNNISYAPMFMQIHSTNFAKNGTPSLVPAMQLDHYFGGTGDVGVFTGMAGYVHMTSKTGNQAAAQVPDYTGGIFGGSAVANDGGTAGAGNGYGALFGGNVFTVLSNGATFWHSSIGFETDVETQTGASVEENVGMKVVLTNGHAVAGTLIDIGIAYSNQTAISPGWDIGMSFGDWDGFWPMKSTGTLIGTYNHTNGGGQAGTAANGVDFTKVTFSASAFKSTGFSVDPAGNTLTKTVATTPTTVGALPAAGAGNKGWRAFVTDANAATFNTIAATGGANNVPVFSDGTNWRIG
jgi:hypothetical protein